MKNTVWSRQKNSKQTVNKGLLLILLQNRGDNNKFNQSDCLIQRLNLCRDTSHFRCFDTTAKKLDEMWTGRPVCASTLVKFPIAIRQLRTRKNL